MGSNRERGMKEKESVLKLDRREILKLLPQTVACLPLLPRSFLTQFLLETASSPTGRVQPGEDEVTAGKVGFTANWIWEPLESALKDPSARIRISGSPRFKNLFTYFRRTVALPVAVEKAALQITGDSRYKLYVNGRYIGRGPARCDQIWQSYDEYEIAPFLKAGKNVIAVQLHFYGENTGWYMLSRPGLLFQCRL